MKKYLPFVVAVAVLILAGIGAWLFLSREETAAPQNPISTLPPFGSAENFGGTGSFDNTGNVSEENASMIGSDGVPLAKIFKLSDAPVAGAVAFTRDGRTAVRYTDRATGHIIESILPGEEAGEESVIKTKITNSTIPKIYEAIFRPDGEAVVYRSIREGTDIIDHISYTLIPPATTTESLYRFEAASLRGEIDSIAASPSGNLVYSLDDSGAVVSSPFNISSATTLFTSPFTEWKLLPTRTNVIVYSKPSIRAEGYAYSLPLQGGSLTRILGPLTGLSVSANKAGTRMLYSYNSGGGLYLASRIVSGGTETETEITPATLAEKCVFSDIRPDFLYCGAPIETFGNFEAEEWRKGKFNFSDYIWSYDIRTEIGDLITNPKTEFGIDIDLWKPHLSPLEDYLIFINKRDFSLWALRL